jgi:hypothetical protein
MTTVVLERAFYPSGTDLVPVGQTEPSVSVMPLGIPLPKGTRAHRGKTLRAKRALEISLAQAQDGQWVADEKVTLQFGVGIGPNDAISDLMIALVNYRMVLQARRYRLAPYLQSHLAWLEEALD